MQQLSDNTFLEFSELIRTEMGLHFPPEKKYDLELSLTAAQHEIGFADMDSFVRKLLTSVMSPEIKRVLQKELTIGETYFFRERPILEKFRALLSTLAAERRKTSRSIRIWSAGCSSGEEPYSLAIITSETLPDYKDWDIHILGTDINCSAIANAREGIYHEWSFRSMERRIIEKNFEPCGDDTFRIKNEFRAMVNFQTLNLFDATYPSPLTKTNSMDFIFCRNVLMYFDNEGRKQVLSKFHNALSDKGYLFLSLTELANQNNPDFITYDEPGIVYYQKADLRFSSAQRRRGSIDAENQSVESADVLTVPAKNESVPDYAGVTALSLYNILTSLYISGKSNRFIDEYNAASQQNNFHLLDREKQSLLLEYCLKAGLSTAQFRRSRSAAQRSLNIIENSPSLLFLYGKTLFELKSFEECEEVLGKCIAADSDNIPAYFLISNIYKITGKTDAYKNALRQMKALLVALPEDKIIDDLDGSSVGDLLSFIGRTL